MNCKLQTPEKCCDLWKSSVWYKTKIILHKCDLLIPTLCWKRDVRYWVFRKWNLVLLVCLNKGEHYWCWLWPDSVPKWKVLVIETPLYAKSNTGEQKRITRSPPIVADDLFRCVASHVEEPSTCIHNGEVWSRSIRDHKRLLKCWKCILDLPRYARQVWVRITSCIGSFWTSDWGSWCSHRCSWRQRGCYRGVFSISRPATMTSTSSANKLDLLMLLLAVLSTWVSMLLKVRHFINDVRANILSMVSNFMSFHPGKDFQRWAAFDILRVTDVKRSEQWLLSSQVLI